MAPDTSVHTLEFADEAPIRELPGPAGGIARGLAIGLSCYAIYWVLFIVQPQVYRVSFLLVALVLTFLLFPMRRGSRRGVSAVDWTLVAATVVAFGWPLAAFSTFIYRAADPWTIDVILGVAAIAIVLEATRRSVGWILPATASAFLIYAYAGPQFDRIGLPMLAHRGYGLERLVGTLYMTLEGLFGVPLDVAATYIVLFTIYGAVLEQSGAGGFFINWATAAIGRSRSGAGPGRTVTLAGFLLGTVSGSGVATTVMLGSVSWPLLRRAGYTAETGGAILSAAGIGALLSPPTLGAAAFLIAEFLGISYLRVLVMATIPTILYYLSIVLMIEGDSRRLGTAPASIDVPPVGELTRRYWYHFTSLVAIAVLMVTGMSAFRAVFWSTLLAVALSYVRRESAMMPARLLAALRSGATGVLGVAATTATAGIIVGVVTLTGLGLKIAGLIVALAAGQRGGGLAAWTRGTGDGVVHHRGGDGGASAHPMRGARSCGAHAHLLLRRPVGGQSADGAVAVCRGCHHGRESLPHDDADMEVHASRLPRAVRLHADGRGDGAAAAGAVSGRGTHVRERCDWHRGNCRGAQRVDSEGSDPPRAGRSCGRGPPPFLRRANDRSHWPWTHCCGAHLAVSQAWPVRRGA
jgi:TRAP-type uncharacterized transport system fused permease subunit